MFFLRVRLTETDLIDGDFVGKVDEQRGLVVDVLDHQRHLQGNLRTERGTLSKPTLGKLLRNGTERVLVFPSAKIPP